MKKINLIIVFVLLFVSISCQKNDTAVPQSETKSSLRQEDYVIYKGKSVEYILEDLASKKVITHLVKESLLSSISGRTKEEFEKEAAIRIQEYSKNSSKIANLHPPVGPGPGPGGPPIRLNPMDDPIFAQLVFDDMTLGLTRLSINWNCAMAVAGIAVSIAGGIVGGPATVAAAAIWGVGHVISVVGLTSCAPTMVQQLQDLSLLPLEEFELIWFAEP